MCGIVLCGILTKTKTINGTPRNKPQAPQNIICPFCSHKGAACYRRRVTYFTLFFIPLCPVKYGDEYISCTSCNAFLGRHDVWMCRSCRCSAPMSYSHCVRCGINLNEEGNRVKE